MKLGMVQNHLFLICVFLVVWPMHCYLSNIIKNWMIRPSNVSLLVTVLEVKVTGCITHKKKCIFVSQDVVFMEDAVQPLLSCTKQTNES